MHSKEFLWEKCLLEIRKVIPSESYDTWFSPIYPHSITDDHFIINVPNEFYKACLEENYHEVLKSILSSLANKSIQLEFKTETCAPIKTDTLAVENETHTKQKAVNINYASSSINFRYNFSNFITGNGSNYTNQRYDTKLRFCIA